MSDHAHFEMLRGLLKAKTDESDALRAQLAAVERERDVARKWVSDLQSGMWVNCIYCGHRYGPGETAPVSMADALKAHAMTCQAHPMSALKTERDSANERVKALEAALEPTAENVGKFVEFIREPWSSVERKAQAMLTAIRARAGLTTKEGT